MKNEPTQNTQYVNMPKPHSLLVLSWEDIVSQADDMDMKITREQCIEVFNKIISSNMDSIMDSFWHDIRFWLDTIHDENKL